MFIKVKNIKKIEKNILYFLESSKNIDNIEAYKTRFG